MKWLFYLLLPASLFSSSSKVVVFDYGGVICTSNYFPLASFMAQTMGTQKPPLNKSPEDRKLKESLNQPPSYWEAQAGKPLDKKWVETYLQNQQHLIVPIPGMEELIQSLQTLNVRMAMLSNTTHSRAAHLQSKGIYAPFNPVLLSCNLDARKPEKKIYEILLRSIGVPPQQCIFIDNQMRNIEAAKEVGIDGILFHSAEQLKEELIKRGIAL